MQRLAPLRLPRLRPARLARPLLLALLSVGCVSEHLPGVDEGGRSLWRRVESEHFVVESNITSDSDVREIASDLETLWLGFASVPILGRRPPAAKPIVVLFESESEYRYFAGRQTAGMFYPETPLGPLILLPPNGSLFQDIVVKHELSHFMCSEFLPHAPKWLNEGLAQVMETASYRRDEGRILFGDFRRDLVDVASLRLPASSFMGDWPSEPSTEQLQRYYAKSWLLVHYLIDDHLEEFLAFLKRVSAGDDWKTTWAGELSVRFDGLDAELDRYHWRAKYGLWTVVARVPGRDSFAQSTAPVADVLALRSVLQAYAANPARGPSQKSEAAQHDLEAAYALDPVNARVQQVRAALADAKR
jgi:hypothetical protein